MSRVALAISILTCTINVATAAWVYHRVSTSALATENRAEVKVVNAKDPILATLAVQREVEYAGQQIATSFGASVRGRAYLVDTEGSRYVLYSPGLPVMAKGALVRGWFQHVRIQDDNIQGKPTFLVPLELISITEPAIENAGVVNPIKLPPMAP